MSKSRFGLAVAVAMAAGALGAGIPGQSANSERVMRALDDMQGQQSPGHGFVKNSPVDRWTRRGSGGWVKERSHKRGPGWSFAHVKRMARKRRNKVTHRAKVQANGGRARA